MRPFTLLLLLLFTLPTAITVSAEPKEITDSKARCAVCGMFVAKYPSWLAQIVMEDGTVSFYDGVKDLMVFFHNPGQFGADKGKIKEIWVKDYYTVDWIDGREAFYVVGSDTYGPMGEELIPFASREAADSFLKDHHGSEILLFSEIGADRIEAMRSGARMGH